MSPRAERQNAKEDRREKLRKDRAKQKRRSANKKKVLRREKKKKAARVRRNLIKGNAELHEEYKLQERERWKKRVAERKVKRVKEMSERERRQRRKTIRESNRKYVAKKKSEQESPVIIEPDDPMPQINSKPDDHGPQIIRKKAAAGRKKVAAHRSATTKKLKKTEEENLKLKRSLWRMQKKVQRLNKQKMSPRTTVRSAIRGKNISPIVRRQLVFAEVVKRQVRSCVNSPSRKVKHAAYQIFSGSLVKHYKMQKLLGLSGHMLRKYAKMPSKDPLKYHQQERKDKLKNKQQVTAFFLTEEASIECPDKRAVKIQFGPKKIKERKRYLKASLKDLYISYCSKEAAHVSFTTFCACKPFYVVERNLKERDTCLCSKCENMDLLLTALGRAKATKVNTPLRLVRSMICAEGTDECYQRTCSECKSKNIPFSELDSKTPGKYHKWVKITEEKQDKNENVKLLKRTVKQEFQRTAQELKEELTSEAEKFLAHKFRKKH